MEKRKLGKSGIEFAPIAFGGNVFGWTADEATSFTGCSTPSSMPASTSSTPPTSIRAGCPATRAASPRRSSAAG